MKRHLNALGIMEGAINMRAIARSLADAADEAEREGVGADQDAAVRLIVYRLARLCRVDEVSYGYDAVTQSDTFCTLMQECKKRAKEGEAPVKIEEPVIMLHHAGLRVLPKGIPR